MCGMESFLSLLLLHCGYNLRGAQVLRTSLRQVFCRRRGTALQRGITCASQMRGNAPQSNTFLHHLEISHLIIQFHSCCPFPSCIMSAKPCHMKNKNFLHNPVSDWKNVCMCEHLYQKAPGELLNFRLLRNHLCFNVDIPRGAIEQRRLLKIKLIIS